MGRCFNMMITIWKSQSLIGKSTVHKAYIYISKYIYICIGIYIYVNVYIYVHVYIYINVHVNIYIYPHKVVPQ